MTMCASAAVIIIICLIGAVATLEDNAYGPFEVQMKSVTSCKGPRRRDCVKPEYALKQNGKQIETSMNVLEDVKMQVMRFISAKVGKRNSPNIVNMEMKNPCEQVIIRDYIKPVVNNTQSCLITKGIHNLTIDLATGSQKFFGGKFFYGDFTTKILAYSNNCNFACIIVNSTITPKP